MQSKIRIFLLIFSLLIGLGLAWVHFQRINLEAESDAQAAEKERHGWVISHDFGLIKEKLIETHRDHWTTNQKDQRLSRWELAGMLTIALIMITLLFMELNAIRRQRRSPH
jgi:hypothetical protein